MRLLATIPFNQLSPDQPDLGNPGIELARNAIPRLNGYDSMPELLTYGTGALPSRAVNAFSAKDADNLSYIYAATEDKLWQLSNTDWKDISRLAPAYTQVSRWEFTKFQQTVIAASLDNRLQSIDFGGANFADLTTSNVQGAALASVRSFIVIGDVKDDDGHTPNRVRWGPINNPSGDWTPDPTTLADFQDLEGEGGRVQRIIGGEYGMVFRERAIHRMTFTGDAAVWQFDKVDPQIGAVSPGSVVQHGPRIYFWTDDGIHVTVGAESQPVGEERVDQSIYADLDMANAHRITGAVYSNEHIIIWAYPGAGNIDGRPNRIALYNTESDRWALGDEAVEVLFRASTPFRSIDAFDDDATYGGIQTPPLYASIDDIPGSLDDAVWAGGAFQLGAIDAGRTLAFYNGPPKPGQFESAERQLVPGRRAFVSELRSLANGANTIEVEIGHRASQKDPVVWENPVIPTAEGFIPTRVENRYMRFRSTLTDGFEDVIGLEIYGEPAGGR